MSPFEYVSVLISIILGLGITVLLTGAADIIRNWKRIRMYWPYAIWIMIVFVLHVQEWWSSYTLRGEMEWTLPLFMFVVIYPIILFVLAHLLFPKRWLKKGVDLKQYYFNNYQKYLIAGIMLLVVSIFQNYFLLHYRLEQQLSQFILVFLFLAVLGSRTKREGVHAGLAVFMIVVLLLSFALRPEELLLR